MASPASPEASEVRRRGRRRLVGAVAIVLLLVVFVPMVLDSEPHMASPGPDLRIPPKDSAPALPAPVPPSPAMQAATPKPGKGEPTPIVDTAKAATEGTQAATEAQLAVVDPKVVDQKAEMLKQAAKVEEKPAPKAEPARPVAPAAPGKPAAKLEGFAIQVGAFRDEDKLRQAREKLGAAGVAHYTERVDAAQGPITRLRAGPFKDRAAADAALARLKGVAPDGKVVPLP